MTRTILVRRAAAATFAAGLVATLAACGGDDSSTTVGADGETVTTVRWIYDWTPTSADLPILKGLEDGWFKEAGLDVRTTPGGEINQLQSVGTGQHDITVGGGVELLINQEQGLPVKSVGVVQPFALNGLICNPDSGVVEGDPASLQGKRLATRTTDADDVVWQTWRDQNGLKGKVEEVAQGAGLPLLFQGSVDCYPEFLTLAPAEAEKEFGKKPIEFWYSQDVGVIGQVLDVNEQFAEKNPEAVKSFVDVYARGMQWAAQNQADAVALLKKVHPETDEEVTTTELAALSSYWAGAYQDENGYLAMDDSSWQPTAEVLQETGQIKEEPDLADVYTTDFLPSEPYLP